MQRYGIKYPFTSDNDEGLFLDLNNSKLEGVKSQILHLIFTPKGQKLRDPEFGTSLIDYIFSPSDGETFDSIKSEITSQVLKYIPDVVFRDITIHKTDNDDGGIIVMVEYGVKKGNKVEVTTVAVKL